MKQQISIIAISLLMFGCSNSTTSSNAAIPNTPQGSWKTTGLVPLIQQNVTYATQITAYNNQVAVGTINSSLNPIIFTCQYMLNYCTVTQVSDFMPDTNAVNALQFDNNSNLFAIFGSTDGNSYNNNSSYFFKLLNNNSRWSYFNYNYGIYASFSIEPNGTTLSAGTTNITGFPNGIGELLVTAPNSVGIFYPNFDAKSLTAVTSDGLGNIYVGGSSIESNEQGVNYVWKFDSSQAEDEQFTLLNGFPQFSSITTMTSDNNGTAYIAATDFGYAGEIWQYKNGAAKNLNFTGYQITGMSYSTNGYLWVSGLDSSYQPQVFSYNTQTESWSDMNIPDSPQHLSAISADPISNTVYVAGSLAGSIPVVWYFVESQK